VLRIAGGPITTRPFTLAVRLSVRRLGQAAMALVACGVLAWVLAEGRTPTLAADDLSVTLPLLLLTGLVLAEAILAAQAQRLADAERRHKRAADALRELSHRHLATLEIKTRLQQRIVSQPESVATLYRIAKRLETLCADDVYPALLDLIVKLLGAKACAVYLERDGELRLQVGHPATWPRRAPVLDRDGSLITMALDERRVVTIREKVAQPGGPKVTPVPIMVGPLVGRDRRPLGVVVVEQLPFLNVTSASVRMFGLLVDWASNGLENALSYEAARHRTVDDEQTGVCGARYTERRLREEVLRAQLDEAPLSLVVVQIVDVELVPL
jgi:hypothetical protein